MTTENKGFLKIKRIGKCAFITENNLEYTIDPRNCEHIHRHSSAEWRFDTKKFMISRAEDRLERITGHYVDFQNLMFYGERYLKNYDPRTFTSKKKEAAMQLVDSLKKDWDILNDTVIDPRFAVYADPVQRFLPLEYNEITAPEKIVYFEVITGGQGMPMPEATDPPMSAHPLYIEGLEIPE